jgi:hypothetical protein
LQFAKSGIPYLRCRRVRYSRLVAVIFAGKDFNFSP